MSVVTTRLIPTSLNREFMNMKNGKRAIAATLAIIAIIALGQSAHAQIITGQADRASYVPGDSGTLTVTILNDASTSLELRNITVYFPWAMFVNGKWDGANVSINLNPWKELGSSSSGNNMYTTSLGFSIPSWFAWRGNSPFVGQSFCPSSTQNRYGEYYGCVLAGTSENSARYQGNDFSIPMALATYTPTSLVAQWLPIATLVVLVVATAFLAMAWMSLRRAAKKA